MISTEQKLINLQKSTYCFLEIIKATKCQRTQNCVPVEINNFTVTDTKEGQDKKDRRIKSQRLIHLL